MDLSVEIRGNTVISHMSGELDDYGAKVARENLDYVLLRKELKYLIFDLTETSFMDSAGIGLFMGRYKVITERKGKVFIVTDNENISKILKMSGITKLMPIRESVDNAIGDIHCKAII